MNGSVFGAARAEACEEVFGLDIERMKQKVRRMNARLRMRDYALIVMGSVVGALAYPLFLTPCNIAPGGLTGVATILHYLFQWPVGMVSLILNLPLFAVGYRAMGRVFAFRSLVATVLFSLLIDLFGVFPPLTDDILLGALFGGIVLGVGLGLILRGGATTGGSDMMARMVHKRLQFISVGAFLFAIDFAVVAAAGLFMQARAALYAVICIFVSARGLDYVLEGVGRSGRACYIISEQSEIIAKQLMTEMNRGVTAINGRGAYSGRVREIVLCVMSSREVPALKRIVGAIDPRAFVFVTGAHEVLGEGFKALTDDL